MFSSIFPTISRMVRCPFNIMTQQRFISTLFANAKNSSHLSQSTRQENGITNRLLQQNHNYICVRTKFDTKIHYKPSAWRRVHKHGLERMLADPKKKQVIWKKLLKGKRELFVFDRFMNYPLKSKKEQMSLPTLPKFMHKFYKHQRQVPQWKEIDVKK